MDKDLLKAYENHSFTDEVKAILQGILTRSSYKSYHNEELLFCAAKEIAPEQEEGSYCRTAEHAQVVGMRIFKELSVVSSYFYKFWELIKGVTGGPDCTLASKLEIVSLDMWKYGPVVTFNLHSATNTYEITLRDYTWDAEGRATYGDAEGQCSKDTTTALLYMCYPKEGSSCNLGHGVYCTESGFNSMIHNILIHEMVYPTQPLN